MILAMPVPQLAGEAFAGALAAKDREAIAALLDPEIDFRGLTPGRTWEATGPGQVLEVLLGSWFEPSDRILALQQVQTDEFADRERVGYRLSVENPEGSFVVEQQAYLTTREGRIDWMRVLCSGFRPLT
jgi:hypothetical protein